jgi:hypothetical protein
MLVHIHSDFLTSERAYADAEQYWIDLWEQIDPITRHLKGWQHPWFQPLPPSISEGNPIFSAVSPKLRKAIRIIQFEPTEKELEFVAYPDTFGGSIFDPNSIHELVISCALSDAAAKLSLSLMLQWVEGGSFSFDLAEAGLNASYGFTAQRIYENRTIYKSYENYSNDLLSDDYICRLMQMPAA